MGGGGRHGDGFGRHERPPQKRPAGDHLTFFVDLGFEETSISKLKLAMAQKKIWDEAGAWAWTLSSWLGFNAKLLNYFLYWL